MESSNILDQAIAYLPQEWRHALIKNEFLPKRAEGAALFADISGFTQLSETLVHVYGLRRGAEELPYYLNQIYTMLIAEVDRYGGSVIDFAGDSITCWFDAQALSRDACLRAGAASLSMQAAMLAFPPIQLLGRAPIVMGVKISFAYGPARRFLVGNPAIQRFAGMAGATLFRMAEGEHLSAPGEIWVDEAAADRLEEMGRVGSQKTGEQGNKFFRLDGMSLPVPTCPWPEIPSGRLSEEQIAPWLPRPVYARLRDHLGEFLTELRPAVSLFLRFNSIDFETDHQAGKKLDELVSQVQKILVTYEGLLIQITIGDKGSYLYAVFGAVVAHEDDARRAVNAALQLREICASIDGVGEVQIGISQGTMRTGTYGSSSRRAYGVLGDDVNLAARLMTRARDGEILVSNRVYQAVTSDRALRSDSLIFEARPPVAMKGKAELVPVFAVGGAQRKRAVRLQEPAYPLPMVGRQAELKLIKEKVELALAGKGQIIGIVADAGVGKSRLIAEAIRLSNRKGLETYGGACQSDAINSPYLVWGAIWRAIFDVNPDSPLKRQVRSLESMVGEYAPTRIDSIPLLGPLLGIEIPDNSFTAELEPQYRRMALEALLVDCLNSAAKEAGSHNSGLVLVLEDLHWIDPVSYDLLERVTRSTGDLPILFLLAYRRPETQPQPAPGVEKLAHFTKILLSELSETETEQAIRAKFAQMYPEWLGPAPRAIIRRVLEQSQGNPFYAEELLNFLNDQNVDFHDVQAVEKLDIPTSLHSLILSRIDQLSAIQQITLKSASVIGRVFQQIVVERMIQQDNLAASLDTSFEELQRRELVLRWEAEQPDGSQDKQAAQGDLQYTFKHVITQEVTYNSLLNAQRRLMHRAAAEAIEFLFPDNLDELSATLAYHFELGGGTEKAIHYLLRAAQRASAIYANNEAISFYQKAVPLVRQRIEKAPSEDWRKTALEVYECLGDVLELIGRHAEAREAYQRAIDQTQANDHVGKSRLFRKIGRTWEVQSQFEQVLAAYEQAEAALGEERDDIDWRREWIDILNFRIYLSYWMSNLEEMQTLIDQLELYINRYGTQQQLGFYLMNATKLNNLLERFFPSEKTILVVERAVEVSREAGDLGLLNNALFHLGFTYLWYNRLDQSEELILESLALAEKMGDLVLMLRILTYLAVVYRRLGDVEKVGNLFPRCLEAAERAQMNEYIGFAFANLAWTKWKKGDIDGFQENFAAVYAAWDRLPKSHAILSHEWAPLFPAMSVALAQGMVAQGVNYARTLLSPGKKRLEGDLSDIMARSVACAESGDLGSASEHLVQAIELAKKYAYL